MNLDLSFYFAVFLRRIHYFALIFALVVSAALAAAILMPAVYSARSVLIMETSQIPGPLDAPRVQQAAVAKLQSAENFLMTRANLLEIAKKNNVFKDLGKMTPDEIVKEMRDHTRLNKSAGTGQATIMEVVFEAESGAIAERVVNEMVTLIMEGDIQSRARSAETTLDFFEQEVKQLDAELATVSAKLLDFQNANADALPSTLAYRMNQQQMFQDRLATTERNITQMKEQKARMIAVFESTGQFNAPTTAQTPEAQQLDQLRMQLNGQLATYSETHPVIVNLRRQITQLEDVVKNQVPVTATVQTTKNPLLDVQLADLDTRIAQEEEQRAKLVAQLEQISDSIARTPANDVALQALQREYQNIQSQYNAAVQKQAAASQAETIELNSKGERFVVVEAATVPDRPVRPNRTMIALGGIFGGALLGLAFIAALEFLNRAVRRPKDLVDKLGIAPIATIPYIRTPSETLVRRWAFAGLLLAALIGIPAVIYAIHVLYMPLDIIAARVAAKFGIRL